MVRGKRDRYGGDYVPWEYIGKCPTCGKRTFGTRHDAKRAAKKAHPNDRMSIYRCGVGWHYGHLPPAVKIGDKPRPRAREAQ